jgi:UDP-N-acetyl-D-galactosamine dehydrogenase
VRGSDNSDGNGPGERIQIDMVGNATSTREQREASTAGDVDDERGGDTVCVVGLGYVGLPLALAFDDAGAEVIGYDVDPETIASLADGTDPTEEVGDGAVESSSIAFTADAGDIAAADYVIVAVPTPVDDSQNPDLAFVESAGETVGEHLTPDTTVVLESTVFPGATESVLVPALESASGLTAGEDFAVGYSPERVSPGDTGRGVNDVIKIVGAESEAVTEDLASLYSQIVDAGVHRAANIETAETAKVIENVQRDINIALVNELAVACEHMGISTTDVLEAAGTKWNFHDGYSPGLVGGHCIPVDPHFLAHRSELDGFSPNLVLQAREINEFMPTHVANLTLKALNQSGKVLRDSEVLVLGLSYKPNVGDIRTSEVKGVLEELREYDMTVVGADPHASDDALREEFGIEIQSGVDPADFDAVVVATAHDEYRDLNLSGMADRMADDPVLVDVPNIFDEADAARAGFRYRCL